MEGEKTNKRTMAFLFLAVAVLLLGFGGASYAYFSASLATSAAANVNMNKLPAGAGSCAGSGTGTVTATAITSSDMQQSANSTTAKTSATSGNIVMTATAPDANTTAVCSYNITWKWTSDYTKTATLGDKKELTYTLQKYSGSSWTDIVSETQFASGKAADTAITLKADSVSAAKTTTPATATYRIVVSWYNADADQSAHTGAIYSGTLGFSNPTIALS